MIKAKQNEEIQRCIAETLEVCKQLDEFKTENPQITQLTKNLSESLYSLTSVLKIIHVELLAIGSTIYDV